MLGEGKLSPRTALIAGLACLAILASLTVIVISKVQPVPIAWLIMAIGFMAAIFYAVPPIRLVSSGYGELTTSLLVAFFVPAFAFVLQTGELHRLVSMSTSFLVIMHIAMLIAFDFPDYSADLKFQKNTLLVRMGWRNGILLHNILVLMSYLLLVVAITLGLPRQVGLLALGSAPIGLLQIWQMQRIAMGRKPSWFSLTLNALSSFGALAYLVTFGFWMS